jgi:hypothetical protein
VAKVKLDAKRVPLTRNPAIDKRDEDPYAMPPELLEQITKDGAAEREEEERRAAIPTTHEGVIQLAQEMLAAKEEADRLEAEAKQHKARYDEIRETLLPDMMRTLGMVNSKGKGSFTFPGGKIHLETSLHASYAKADEVVFFDWLRSNGAEDMIKEVVHTQTLSAFIRERRGDDLPDPPGVRIHEPMKAKLTRAK